MPRIFFVTRQDPPATYCSLCGKRVAVKDSYNHKQHVLLEHGSTCVEAMYDKILPEGSYVYSFVPMKDTLYLTVSQVFLQERPWMPGSFMGTTWKEVVRIAFPQGERTPRIMHNETADSKQTWMERIANGEVVRMSVESDVALIHEVFPSVLDIYDLRMFFHLYQLHGYPSEPFLTPSLARTMLAYELPKLRKKLEMLKNDVSEAYPAVVRLHKEKATDRLFLELLILDVRNHDRVLMFLFSDTTYVYTPDMENLNLRVLIGASLAMDKESLRLARTFGQAYPKTCLVPYLKNAGKRRSHPKNILAPLLGSSFHKLVELTAKAGAYAFPQKLQLPYFAQDPATYSNLRQIFGGLPLHFIRTLPYGSITTDFMNVYHDVMKRNPAFLIDGMPPQCAFFLKEANVADRGCNARLHHLGTLPDAQILRIMEYLRDKSVYAYTEYRDYVNMCEMAREYPFGLMPHDIYAAHRYMTVYGRQRYYDNVYGFDFAGHVHSPDYLRLTTEVDAAEEDDKAASKAPFMVLAPEKPDDLYEESSQMHNCVRTYIPSVAEGHTSIYFLRKKDNPSHSFGTIEVRDKQIVQAKGFANSRLPAPARKFVKDWAKEKGLAIKTLDL